MGWLSRKSLLVTSLVIVASSTISAQHSARISHGLKGPVKSVLLETSRVSQNLNQPLSNSPPPIQKRLMRFDQNGRYTEEVDYAPNDRVFLRTTHEHSADGTERQTTFDANGDVQDKWDFKRRIDSAGRDVETLIYLSDGTLRNRMIRNYDAQGRFVE